MPTRRADRVADLGSARLERVRAHRGRGRIGFRRLFGSAEFATPVNFVDYAVLPPGTSIGGHRHGRDEEIYVVLAGRGRMQLDGREFDVRAGSVVVNRPGGTHGLVNTGARELRLLVVEVALAGRGRERRP